MSDLVLDVNLVYGSTKYKGTFELYVPSHVEGVKRPLFYSGLPTLLNGPNSSLNPEFGSRGLKTTPYRCDTVVNNTPRYPKVSFRHLPLIGIK